MAFLVELTAEAEREADAILEWLLTHNAGSAGLRWFNALEDAIASLSEFPERCALAPEDRVFPFEVRQLLYGHKPHVYRILFRIERETVYVLHIRHGRRAPITQ
jgi:plasmid stabilization system protein ParE